MPILPQRHIQAMKKMARKASWDTFAIGLQKKQSIVRIHERISETGEVEFVDRCQGQVYIEPANGYVISDNYRLHEHSLLPDHPETAIPWRYQLPSLRQFRRAVSGKQVVEMDAVVSLRHLWEWNYYHFQSDVLGKLDLFASAGIDRSTPLVLGRYAMELSFVKDIIQRGELKTRNWIIQDNFIIKAKEAYFCRSNRSTAERFRFLEEMDLPAPNISSARRVYLTRGKGATRRVENEAQVISVMKKYGFEIVDTAGMSIDEQINLFSSIRFLVAVHGAGMINIVYRHTAPMSILEICPTIYHNSCFQRIANTYGFQWRMLEAEPTSSIAQHTNMIVDCDLLEAKTRDLLLSYETQPS